MTFTRDSAVFITAVSTDHPNMVVPDLLGKRIARMMELNDVEGKDE